MPDLPGSHAKTKPKASRWDKKTVVRQLTGRPWRRIRDRILARDKYLCQRCLSLGLLTPASEVDHITPIHLGEDNQDHNLQSLCSPCHKAKTATEGGHGSLRPEWLPKPACPVTVVSGPPGAGKTTWARAQGGTVIDLDDCFLSVCGVHGHEADRKYLDAAIRLRNSQLADLAGKRSGHAYLIVSEPIAGKVKWWMEKLGADHKLIDPGLDVCLSRVSGKRAEVAREWYQRRNYTSSLGST